MLVRATLILIALFVGGWMVFDGIHVLIYGRFFGPENPARGARLSRRWA
jgi:hypothetical protein